MGVQLRRLGPHSQVKALPLTDEDAKWTVGRGSNSDIFTLSRFASRTHFSIIYRNKNFYIFDHGSSNGTYVNDKRILPQHEFPLPLNCIISVGVLSVHQNEPDCIVFAFELCEEKQSVVKQECHTEDGKATSKGVEGVEIQYAPAKTSLDGKRQESGMKAVRGELFYEIATSSNRLKAEKVEWAEQCVLTETKETDTVEQKQEKGVSAVKAEQKFEISSSNESLKNMVDMISVKKEEYHSSTALANNNTSVIDAEIDLFEPEGYADDEIVHAFEAQTQVDEPVMRNSQLSYSVTEDFIEISDSEDDTVNSIKIEMGHVNFAKSDLEDGHGYIDIDDDDVICLDIIKSNKENYPPIPEIKIQDDDEYTETDMKWIGKLFKTEEECSSFIQSQRENMDSGDPGELNNDNDNDDDDDWLEDVRNCAKEIGEILLSEHDKEGKMETENSETSSTKPKEDNFPLGLTDDNSTVIGLLTISPEKKVPVESPSCSVPVKKHSCSTLIDPKNKDKQKKYLDDSITLKPVRKKPKLELSSSRINKPSTSHEYSKGTILVEHIPPKRSTKRTRGRKKNEYLPAWEKKRIKEERRKKLRDLSLKKPPNKDIPKIVPPIKVKIQKNRGEYLCYEITREKDSEVNVNEDSGETVERTKRKSGCLAKKDEPFLKETIETVPTKDDSCKVQQTKTLEEVNEVLSHKSESNQVERFGNVNLIIRQEAGRPVKSCLKKFGYAFMRTNRPIVPLKRVQFDTTRNIKYYETENRITRKTSLFQQCMRNKTHDMRIVRYRNLIADICGWNASWLEECKTAPASELPPSFQRLRNVQKKFRNHEHYTETFVPLLLLELWHTISESWRVCSNGMYRFPAFLRSYTEIADRGNENLGLIKCESIAEISPGLPLYVREGDLLMIQITKTNGKKEMPGSGSKKLVCRVFGFLEKKTVAQMGRDKAHPYLMESCAGLKSDKILKLEILVMKRSKMFKGSGDVFQITGVYHVAQRLIQCQAVCTLSMSQLCQTILSPGLPDLSLWPSVGNETITFTGLLDESQRELVLKLVSSCTNRDRNFVQIQGGPGTGKTHVIVAFILQLLYTKQWKRNSLPKILYCAHSNIVVDDMTLKLKNYRQTLSQVSRFKLVRYGHLNAMKPAVRDVSTCLLGLKNDHQVNIMNKMRTLEEKIKLLVADLERPSMFSQKTIDEKSSNLHAYVKERETLKTCKPVYTIGQRPTYESERVIIENADIICCPCVSTGAKIMMSAFERIKAKNPLQKIICIVDEAMQSKESETIVPLQLGVTDLILVGDSRQLKSPVRNEVAQSLGVNQSLFWRILSIFEKSQDDLFPIVTLKTQYRMNSAISAFPNKLLYNNNLKDGRENKKIFNVDDYVVLIDNGLPESFEDCEIGLNTIAVKLVKELLNTMADDILNNNFGIITCRMEQSTNLRAALTATFDEKVLSRIEVNPIENVQGREFDIVLFIFDPNMDCAARANVAITRAKYSLIILTSESMNVNNKFLKKLVEDAIIRGVFSFVSTKMEGQSLINAVTKTQVNI